ncbi:MAG: glycosyl hydrolase 115 family protein [Saonia sp.]
MCKIQYGRTKIVVGIFTLFLLLASCSKGKKAICYLVVGDALEQRESIIIKDLILDLNKVLYDSIHVISEEQPIPNDGKIIVVGTIVSNKFLAKLLGDNDILLTTDHPGPRGGIWAKIPLSNEQDAIILAGSDIQGLQYAVYDYAEEVLGIDPLAYWTGRHPLKNKEIDLFDFKNREIAPPKVPILCYFENDVDELANYRGKLLEYDWESYTEMINSLVRLRYNAIQFFDMLGRPEFFLRPEYKKLAPDYQIDLKYLEKMMDYAHSRGMKIQVDFALSYQIQPMDEDKASCWKEYKKDWVNAWRYYFEETPLAKTDIFILRPRNQVWDWEYKSSCGEDKVEVFNEVFKVFDQLVDSYRSNATKALICYSDAMEMYNDGFRPPKDWIIAWADNGFGDFDHMPETTDGYQFGTYMHAGFWLNHTVHNPYPEKVETEMKTMFDDYGADAYCMVNGQNFRPFLLNLEAYSKVCYDPNSFDGEVFYETWSQRYFDNERATYAVNSMKSLNKAQNVARIGYVQHLWEIREAIAYLSNSPIERPGKPPVPNEFEQVKNDIENVIKVKKHVDSALAEAQKGLNSNASNHEFYYSYIYVPALLYNDLITFEMTLHKMCLLKRKFETSGNQESLQKAMQLLKDLELQLSALYKNRMEGDKNSKWAGWYDPKIRRPNNGFPSRKMLNAIVDNLTKMAKKQ